MRGAKVPGGRGRDWNMGYELNGHMARRSWDGHTVAGSCCLIMCPVLHMRVRQSFVVTRSCQNTAWHPHHDKLTQLLCLGWFCQSSQTLAFAQFWHLLITAVT